MFTRVGKLTGIVILAAIYAVTARLGLAFDDTVTTQELLWAPTGLGLAAVLLAGPHLALGVGLGTFAAIAWLGLHPLAGAAIGTMNMLETLAAYYALRALDFHRSLDRVRDVMALLAVAVIVSLVSTLASTLWLVAMRPASIAMPEPAWLPWWWGHLAGDLIVTPLLLTWVWRWHERETIGLARALEASALGLAFAAVGLSVFVDWLPWWLPGSPMASYLCPLLVWAGLRFGPTGAATANAAIGLFAIAGFASERAVFAELADFQSFLSIAAVGTLTVGALRMELVRAIHRKGAIQEAALDAIVTIDRRDRIVELNPAAEQLFRIDARSAIGRDVRPLLVPASSRETYRDGLAGHLQTEGLSMVGKRVRHLLKRADGTEFPAEIAIARIPVDNGEDLFTGFVRDITAEMQAATERRQSRELLEQNVRDRTAALRRGEQLLREAQELAHLGSFDFDVRSGALQWSDEMFRIYGRDPATFQPTYGAFLAAVHPEDRAKVGETIRRALHDHGPFNFEERIVRPDGSSRILQSQGRILLGDDGRPSHVLGCCQDITERKHAEAARINEQQRHRDVLRDSLREKEGLLREIHHRVKNNLQVISSLLNLQLASVPNEEARKGLIESQSRIQSMALLHQLLYQSKDLARIELGDYLHALVSFLGSTYDGVANRIETTVTAPPVRLDLDRAIPCGLIVTELVTNSMRHAFPDHRRGRISVDVSEAGEHRLVLEVTDDGVGIPEGIDIDSAQSFGLQIARHLSRQLDGTIEILRGHGTTIRVTFPF